MDVDDLAQPLSQRRVRREHRLPKRYWDTLPEPPAALPIPLPLLNPIQLASQELPPTTSAGQGSSLLSQVKKILKSTCNIFGLFRQYNTTHFLEHDPDGNLTSDDLMDTLLSLGTSSHLPVASYHPYPNHTSFLLGEWYWNDRAKKSQSSFKNLLSIIGHPDFQPEDVSGMNWRRVNAQLGGDHQGHGPIDRDSEDGWEEADGDWTDTPIKIKVPFHRRTLHPGQEEFVAGTLRHRKLVSVIWEKILTPSSHRHLHFEPYELYWQPNESSEPLRVHGELYSSEAFIDVHQTLQDSPGELGCDLPKVVVGLMFASDATHLTAFSDAKLSPIYLGIRNESKDRRSKPSCHTFEHIAYFETVSSSPLFAGCEQFKWYSVAPRCFQSFFNGPHWWEGTQASIYGSLSLRSLPHSVGDNSG